MKLLVDFLPIVIFFIIYKFAPELIELTSGLYSPETKQTLLETKPMVLATAVLVIVTCLQMLIIWLKNRKLETMQKVTLFLIILLGGATVLLQNEAFIQWKPTIANWLFGAAFLGSQFIGKKNILQRMMGDNLSLSDDVWRNLNYMWVTFFISLGFINLYVAYNFSEDFWVNFKLFGMLGLTFLFIILQSIYLTRHISSTESEEQ